MSQFAQELESSRQKLLASIDGSRDLVFLRSRDNLGDDLIYAGIRQLLRDSNDTVIGERDATLSAGEKQRLSIAHAVLKDAPVLILDEPTSAMDATTEATLLDAFERLTRGRTIFVIAHRLSTIHRADRIVVLEGGRVVEVGSHSKLRRSNGLYQTCCNLQSEPSPGSRAAGFQHAAAR